jgi:hypothetical protein
MKKLVGFVMAFVIISCFNACQKEEFTSDDLNPESQQNEEQAGMVFVEGQMELGEQLENPYSVENMRKALENVESQLKSATKVEPTHYYVRFRPKSEQELGLITRDTTLYVYDYPLDVEVKRGGTHYHDPSIPANEITWQYTVVPIDYVFPDVQYQKLAELFLPEERNELQELKSASLDHFDWLKLETEALRITGNLNERNADNNTLKSTYWRPSGTIRVYDDVISSSTTTRKVFDHYEYYDCETGEIIIPDPGTGPDPILKQAQIPENDYCTRAVYRYETSTSNSHLIPIEGVVVRARRWFTTHEGITDANGDFSCDGTFQRDANYSIKWEKWDFDIRDGSYGQAYYNGPKQTGEWNLDIINTPKSKLFAHIFRAAYTYYYKHANWGIKAPPRRDGLLSFLDQRLHIGGKDKAGTSHYFDFNELVQSATVVVYSMSENGRALDSREIFGTSIHELAHASHWALGYTDINWLLNKRLTESWATGVEAVITNDVYKSKNYNTKQTKTISDMSDGYTSIVWDMIDNVNQYGSDPNYPDDQVSGYTISQLENALPGTLGSWWTWRDNIKDYYNNPTELYLDKLFQDLK